MVCKKGTRKNGIWDHLLYSGGWGSDQRDAGVHTGVGCRENVRTGWGGSEKGV